MTIKEIHLYRDMGDHIAHRDASVYIIDNRDKRGLDGQPIYCADGTPKFIGDEPPWRPPPHFHEQPPIERHPEEKAFDHYATDEELEQAFPGCTVRIAEGKRVQAMRDAVSRAPQDGALALAVFREQLKASDVPDLDQVNARLKLRGREEIK